MEADYFGVHHDMAQNQDSLIEPGSRPGSIHPSNLFEGSDVARDTQSSMLSPQPSSDGRHRPSPVPNSEARVRWAMLASLAGVKEKDHTSGTQHPTVTIYDDRGRPLSSSQPDQSRRLSRSQEPRRPKETPLSPPIPIRSRPGSVHARKPSESRFKAKPNQDESESTISNPTSIEQYLRGLRNDPNIDDRGLKDGLQSLILGSGDGDHVVSQPEESVENPRTAGSAVTPGSRLSSTSSSDTPEEFSNGVGKQITARIPNLSSEINPVRRSCIPFSEQLAQGRIRPSRSSSNISSWQQPTSIKAPQKENYPQHENAGVFPERAAANYDIQPFPKMQNKAATGTRNNIGNSERPLPAPLSAAPTPAKPPQSTYNTQQLEPRSPNVDSSENRSNVRPLTSGNPAPRKSTNHDGSPPQPAKPYSSAAPQTAKAQEGGRTENLKVYTDSTNHARHDAEPDSARCLQAQNQQRTPPSLSSRSAFHQYFQDRQQGDHQDPHPKQPPSAPRRTFLTDSSSGSPTPQTDHAQSSSTPAPIPRSTSRIPQNSATNGATVTGSFMPMQSPPTPPQTPGLLGRSPVPQHPSVEENQGTKAPPVHLDTSSAPQDEVKKTIYPAENDRNASSFPPLIVSLPQNSTDEKTGPQNSPRSIVSNAHTHQKALLTKAQAGKRLGSPAAAIRAEIAKERQEKLDLQQRQREHLPKPTESTISEPPVSGPQAMLNMLKNKFQKNVDASNGNPGFVDQMIQLVCKMAQDAMPEIERRLAHNTRITQQTRHNEDSGDDSESDHDNDDGGQEMEIE